MMMDATPTPLGLEPDDEVTQLLRGALHVEASGVHPPDRFADLLAAIEADADDEPQTRPTLRWLAVAAIAVVALGVATPFVLPRTSTPPSLAVPTSAMPTSPSTTPATPTAATTAATPLYYVGRDGLLYREFRDVPRAGAQAPDALVSAVSALLNLAPLDPDYVSRWASGQVNSATLVGDRITVDLSESAFASFTDTTRADEAINQLVYTVTAVVGDPDGVRSVVVLVDGKADLPILGAPDNPFYRRGLTPLGFVWVTTPQQGEALPAGNVDITGEVRPELGAVTVQVRDASDVVVREVDATLVDGGGSWQSYEAGVTLDPGTWTLVVVAGGHTESKVVVVS